MTGLGVKLAIAHLGPACVSDVLQHRAHITLASVSLYCLCCSCVRTGHYGLATCFKVHLVCVSWEQLLPRTMMSNLETERSETWHTH